MTKALSLGFSPCPNDTFIFYALVHNHIPLERISFTPPLLEDVETLNRWAIETKLDVTKLSFHAMGHLLDEYVILTSGAALGRGCGPLLITRPDTWLDLEHATIAIPGTYTTAAMLLRLYAPHANKFQVMRFEEIMPAVGNGTVDAGVIIHESRFTYQDLGLIPVQDLGEWWEDVTGLPIPLGCIAARRDFSREILTEIDQSIRASLEWARANPDRCMEFLRTHAQEMDENVLQNHVSLYVNEFSLDLGDEGKRAVAELLERGKEAGIFPGHNQTDLFAG